ncbi:MAG: LysM peptidoglycan-binding domain-containing protein [Oscillospiraceae bacterium]|nr:LysM peptidoglycan-binding domain-containing protein [Oscillospiraceae bacterium]
MKKRIVSLLLSLCLVFALFCGMSVNAFADGTVEYTLKAGETVFGVCQKLGIDFYANQAWIMQTNNIASFNNLKAGTKLTLPAAGTAATAAAAGGTATMSTGDPVNYYLVEHVMAAGETVYTVCKQLGIDFAANSDKIKAINGISNYNAVKVGATVVLPSTTAPTSGTYTQVVAHKVVAGDTVGALCRTYGVDYASSAETIKALSGITNLGAIRAGQTIYLPVKAGTAATTTSSSGTGSSAGSGSGASSGGTAAAPVNTTPEAGAFNVHTSSNGVFNLQVNGQIVNSAKAGEKVTVVVVPDQGYKVNDIVIYKTSTSERVTVSNNTFTMPDHDITIYVTFRAG